MDKRYVESSTDLPDVVSIDVSVRVTSIRRAPIHAHALPFYQRLAFSFGHVLNDLCAAMWFSYLLIYYHSVIQFDNVWAGYLMLTGQIADGLATPFVGLQSDKEDDFFLCRYGKRKTWHLVGTLCVIISFPFLFSECVGCTNSHLYAKFIYYAAFIVVFQFGWAATQISHLSLIPELTPFSSERIELNALRYAFTVASNIFVYSITLLILGIGGGNSGNELTPAEAPLFRNIVLIVVGVGILFSASFHILVKERRPLRAPEGSAGNSCEESLRDRLDMTYSVDSSLHLNWVDWFKEPQFYLIGLLYMATRLYCNLTQAYIPLYVSESLHLNYVNIAIIPLVVYFSGFISSFFMKFVNVRAGTKITYLIGGILAMVTTLWLYFLRGDKYYRTEIYAVAALIGVSTSTVLVTSLAITADLIAHNTSSGAFVYGSMSFMDKVSNGVAVLLVQYFHPCKNECSHCEWYYEHVLVYVCGGAALLGLIFLATLTPYTIGDTKSKVPLRPGDTASQSSTAKENGDLTPLLQDSGESENFGTIN